MKTLLTFSVKCSDAEPVKSNPPSDSGVDRGRCSEGVSFEKDDEAGGGEGERSWRRQRGVRAERTRRLVILGCSEAVDSRAGTALPGLRPLQTDRSNLH